VCYSRARRRWIPSTMFGSFALRLAGGFDLCLCLCAVCVARPALLGTVAVVCNGAQVA
jgi:hypothetical protein